MRIDTPPYHFDELVQVAPSWIGRWTAQPSLPYFDGHFPNDPVVPAVAILDVSLAFIEAVTNSPKLRIMRARQGKFKRPMRPGDSYEILATPGADAVWHIEWRPPGDSTVVEVSLVVDQV